MERMEGLTPRMHETMDKRKKIGFELRSERKSLEIQIEYGKSTFKMVML